MTILWNAIRILRPDVGFGIGNEEDWDTIQMSDGSDRPTDAEIQSVLEEAKTAAALAELRIQRDQLLSATDWWCVSDRTPTPEQLQYRQALRDLPANAAPALDENGQLTGVEWPTKPE